MRIKSVRVQNLRAIRDCTLYLDSLTALVGPGGAGKSTFLHALTLFQGIMAASEEDYHNRDTSKPIEVKITFDELPDPAKERLSKYVRNGELDVARIIYWEDGRATSTLHGFSLRNKDFEGVLDAPNPTVARERYQDLLSNPDYRDLPVWSSFPKIKDHLQSWEEKNPGKCAMRHDSGRFFGYGGTGAGCLERYIRILYVPAVCGAAGGGKDGKGSAPGDLLDLTVDKALAERGDLQSLQGEIKQMYDRAMGPHSLPDLAGLEADLGRALGGLASGARACLDWSPPDPNAAMPHAEARLAEGGRASPAAGAGHGLQRALAMAVLHRLSAAQATGAQDSPPAERPSLVLAIEYPELGQHPARMRRLAGLLCSLSDGGIPGAAGRMQVAYTTHSPRLVFADRIGQVRLVGRSATAAAGGGGRPWATSVSGTTPAAILEDLKRCGAAPGSAGSLDHFLLRAVWPAVSEGFFADIVVLVEAQPDRIILEAAAEAMGRPLDALGAAVVQCGSKSSMPIPIAMFRRLGMPVYAVWGADGSGGGRERASERIASALGCKGGGWRGRVTGLSACLPKGLEGVARADLRDALGSASGERPDRIILERRRALHGIAETGSRTLDAQLLAEEIREKPLRLRTVESIVERIADMSPGGEPPPRPGHPLYKSGRIPSPTRMTYPVLEFCSGGKTKSTAELEIEMCNWLGLLVEQGVERIDHGLRKKTKTSMSWALLYLHEAGLLDKKKYKDVDKYRDRRERAHYTITQEGERVVADPNISNLTLTYLQKKYPARQERNEGDGKHA